MIFRKMVITTYFILLLVLPILLIILPSDFFDNGQSVCFSVLLFDQECPGCGMTRGVQHLLHLDFMTAYQFNKLSLIVLPLLMFLWLKEVYRITKMLFLKKY